MAANDTLLLIAEDAVKRALAKGAKEVAAGAYRVLDTEVRWRDGKLERLTESTTRGLSLQLYADDRYASVSTSDLRPEALDRFITDSVALTRTLAKDPHRKLPEAELYEGQAKTDLAIDDPAFASVETPARMDTAKAIEAAARAADKGGVIISVTGYVGGTQTELARVHSNGFSGVRKDTMSSLSASVSVKDADGRKPGEGWSATARFAKDLPTPEVIGKTALERALGCLGAKRTESKKMTLVVENRAVGRLVSYLFDPLSARALQQKRSCLEGKAGTPVGSKLLDVQDDPLVVKGLGSRLFDGEGLAGKKFPLFEAGVLRGYYVDNYYGRKLGAKPTTAKVSNLVWTPGQAALDGLVAGVRDGVLVTGFIGGNSNATTGDFSMGIQGFRIRGGKLAEPVVETNVADNHLELWKRLVAVGNDPWTYSSLRTPSLVFEDVQVAGA